MTERLPWFPCFPSKLLGALSGMRPDEGYLYWVVCLRIYEIGGPCADTLDALSRRTGLNKRRVSDNLDHLFRSGKLIRQGDGIMNPFAEKVIGERTALREERVRAGRAGGLRTKEKTERKQENDPSKATAKSDQRGTHLHLDLEIQKEGKEDIAPKRRDDWPDDHVEQFWNRYPPFRRSAKKTVAAKLAGIRRRSEVTWERLMAGLDRYVASEPGEFAKGPVVWLNGGCWDDEVQQRGQNGKARSDGGQLGFSGLAAKIRSKSSLSEG